MQKMNLNVVFDGQSLTGFQFGELPLGAAMLVAQQQIDQAADLARLAVLGEPLRVVEYNVAAHEARAFADADYSGEVPPSVQAWVDAAGLSAWEAADDILAKAAAWKEALYKLRAIRLKGKQDAAKATTHAAIEGIADTAIEAIKASVQGVGNAA
ncbi:hypothetical protein [Pseudomonas cremoricolorata]|uniref:hypothetical protein n=1 Tax=Pseudomonas cremoricolorata TaxID=157783 RepID=UPI00041B5F83|nr:hypothetical protein [Pseudomonas cremoricolorata]